MKVERKDFEVYKDFFSTNTFKYCLKTSDVKYQ